MRWSVLLPTHAAPATLGFAIDSVLAQRDSDLELLIVGDGCDDETRTIIAGYRDTRIQFFDNPKGIGFGYEHRRVALESARGDLVAFMSDDDLWASTHLTRLGKLLDAGSMLAYSRSLWCVPSGYLVPLHFNLNDEVAAVYFEQRNYLPAPCVTVTRSALEDADGWPVDVSLAGDWELWRRIGALPGARVAYDHDVSSVHFRSDRRSKDPMPVEAILALPHLERWWPAEAIIDQGIHPNLQSALAARMTNPSWWSQVARGLDRVDSHLVFAATFLAPELARSSAALGRVNAQLDDLYASRSWRATAPLRRVGDAVRAIGRGAQRPT
jgi:glycosyltransferase involved in cell wall biosynthesis